MLSVMFELMNFFVLYISISKCVNMNLNSLELSITDCEVLILKNLFCCNNHAINLSKFLHRCLWSTHS